MINNNAMVDSMDVSASDIATISVFEHQRLTAHDFLHDSDFIWLMVQEFAVFSIKRHRGQWQLKVGHYIGIVLLPSGMMLEILPKIMAEEDGAYVQQTKEPSQSPQNSALMHTRQWVQKMLSDLTSAHNPNRRPNTQSFGQYSHQLAPLPIPAPPLSEWLVMQFLQRLTHYQPTQHYQAQTHNQTALQGRLLIKEQLRHNSVQPHKFVCETSVLSQDMLSNRLIKSALVLIEPLVLKSVLPDVGLVKFLQPWRQVRAFNHHELRQLESLYGQAKRQIAVQPLSQQQLQAAQQALDLAYWLLQHSSVDTGSVLDSKSTSKPRLSRPRLCVFINMNQAFEQWASLRIVALFHQTNPHYQSSYQTQSVWLSNAAGQTCLSVRPDLLMYRVSPQETSVIRPLQTEKRYQSRIYSHIIDIKWKYLPHSSAISASDAYQLSSYAHVYQAGQVWLVYPVSDSIRQPEALKQQVHGDSDGSSKATLWLMPFNVLTGTLNGRLPEDLTLR